MCKCFIEPVLYPSSRRLLCIELALKRVHNEYD